MPTRDQALTDIIRKAVAERGPVSFAWFMEQALYHPEFGYYSSGECQIGRQGDYFTNVSVGPLFGRLVATQFAEMWEILGRPPDFTIVEQGAHHGDFAHDVLAELRERFPDFFLMVRYTIVEPFEVLEARQHEKLAEFAGKAAWRKSVGDLESFIGVHFSNELLDAMPVKLVSRDGAEEWKERLVDRAGDGFSLVAKPIRDEKLRRHLEKIPRAGDGCYETEVNLAALNWVVAVSRKLNRGFVLTVDYGYPRLEFYAPERVTGTLQCRAAHRAIGSPLTDIGRVDLTTHVDWTSVGEEAEQHGLVVAGFTDQHHFIAALLGNLTLHENERRALQTLLHPELLGTRFQYLALAKDAPTTSLSGFRFARNPRQVLFQ